MLKHRLPNLIFKDGFDQAGFYLALARKDVGLATELAREFNVPMNVASLAEQALIEGLARGWDAQGLVGDLDAAGGARRGDHPARVPSSVVGHGVYGRQQAGWTSPR